MAINKMGNKWGEPCSYLAHYLEKVSRLWHMEGEPRQSTGYSVLNQQKWNLGKPRQLELTGQSSWEERAEYRDLWRSAEDPLWVSIWVPVSPCMWRILRRPGKEPPKRIWGKSTQSSHKAKNNACFQQSEWNLGGSDYNTKKGLALGKNFNSKLNAALILPNKIKK